MRPDSEHEKQALTVLDHLDGLGDGDLLRRLGPARGEHGSAQLGREPFRRIRELLEAPFLGEIHEIVAMMPDARGARYPVRHLYGRARLLRDREPEQDQIHVKGHREVSGAGYDASVRLSEVLIVGVVEAYGDPAASHHCFLLRPTMAYASPSRKTS